MRQARRANKKNRALLRFVFFTLIFLLALAIVWIGQKYATGEWGNSSVSGTDTEQTPTTDGGPTDPSTSTQPDKTADCDPAVLQSVAQSLFAGENYSADHMVIYDLTAGVTLYSKGAEERITAASTTKLLTALTMLDYVTNDTVFTVGSELSMVGKDSSTAGLKKGYTLTVEQVLDALLIPSGNDAAYVIAAHVGRNLAKDPEISDRDAVDLFLERMNNKAKSLGATDSLFTCPDGYPNKTQYTTAADMMKISIVASRNGTVMRSVNKVYAVYTMNNGTELEFTTTNKLLLPSSSFFYEGTFGLKTGSTPAAGQCVISGASAYGHDLLIALFKAPTSDSRWSDCRNAFDVAFRAVQQAQEAYGAQN